MIIDNVKVYTEEKTFVKGGIMLGGDKIQRVYTEEEKPQFGEKEVLDGEGAYAIPGLIDLHFHGCKGDDFVMEMKRRLRGSHSMRPPLV